MIFDSHAHLDDKRFGDREEIIANLYDDGIKYVLNPGADRESSERAYKLAKKYDNIYGAVGTHPHDAKDFTEDDLKRYEELSKDEKILAIGETGLDFYYDNSPRDIQEKVFREQLDLCIRTNLPVIIHTRDAIEETYNVLKDYEGKVKGIIHCYSDNWENAQRFLDLGYLIGLGGVVTFKKSEATREVAKNIPIERLVLETDAPYLSPEPFRGRRNEPKYTKVVAEKIAEVRNEDVDYIIEQTFSNAMEIFGLWR